MGKIMDIIKEECKKGNISVDTVLSDIRTLRVSNIRQLAMWRARTELNETYLKLGRIFKRDHTSVINGVRRVERLGYDVVAGQYEKSLAAQKDHQARKITLQSARRRAKNMEIIYAQQRYEHRNDM